MDFEKYLADLEDSFSIIYNFAAKFRFCRFMHSKSGFADRMPRWKLFRIFRIVFVQRSDTFSMINTFDQVINSFHIITLICDESACLN